MEFPHVVLEPWRRLSCLAWSPSVQLVRLPLAVVCWQYTSGIVLKDCIVCLEEFTWYPWSLLFCGAQTAQRSEVAAAFSFGSCSSCPAPGRKYHHFAARYPLSQSHCCAVVLSYIHREVKKPATSYFYINLLDFLEFVGWFSLQMLVEPGRISWRFFPNVHRLCWPPEVQLLSNLSHRCTGQPSVQLTGRSVFTSSVRFIKGRMYINSSFSRYFLWFNSS